MQLEISQPTEVQVEPFKATRKFNMAHVFRPANVLIVDDDVDAILPMNSLFRGLGCATSYAITSREAWHQMASGLYDIILLDWNLGQQTGGEVLQKALRVIQRFQDHRYMGQGFHPRLITYSGSRRSELVLPDNKIFVHVDHWRKPVITAKIREEAARLAHEVEVLKTA